ncbi:MAG: hypothetical protein CMH55_07585 [Myxococcales bacterium]|nr:hypothetical protein [Myxococcales bacterium]|tara:strand:- start:104 stop:472 length:369 start_codon:yes stop_codon:yes gene_type:complete
MTTNSPLRWKRTFPSQPGWYWFRLTLQDPVEVVHVYESRPSAFFPNYSWATSSPNKRVLIAKRMHEPEADQHDALQGFYLCPNASETPLPLEEPPKAAKAKPKKQAAPKEDLEPRTSAGSLD